ncbi:MAG: HAD family hydrolase [bacterium]
MNKILIFDADGVTIKLREKFFSQRLSEDYGISSELVIPLFKNEFYKCVLGEMDLKEVLKKYIIIWKWKGTIDELLEYWWQGESQLNIEVIEEIKKLRKNGDKVYLATDQEKYRANNLMQNVGLKNYLDGAFFSYELKLSKATKVFWIKVLELLGNPDPKDVKFFDDEKENVEAALQVGVDAVIFQNPHKIC